MCRMCHRLPARAVLACCRGRAPAPGRRHRHRDHQHTWVGRGEAAGTHHRARAWRTIPSRARRRDASGAGGCGSGQLPCLNRSTVRSRVTVGETFVADLERLEYHEDGDDEPPPVQSDYGSSLWSRVATLTVNVSKAWASNITTHSGERASYLVFFVCHDYIFAMQRRRRVKSRVSHGP